MELKQNWLKGLLTFLLIIGIVVGVAVWQGPEWLREGILQRFGGRQDVSEKYESKTELTEYKVEVTNQEFLEEMLELWEVYDIGGVVDPSTGMIVTPGDEKLTEEMALETIGESRQSVNKVEFLLVNDLGGEPMMEQQYSEGGVEAASSGSRADIKGDVLVIKVKLEEGFLDRFVKNEERLSEEFSQMALISLNYMTVDGFLERSKNLAALINFAEEGDLGNKTFEELYAVESLLDNQKQANSKFVYPFSIKKI